MSTLGFCYIVYLDLSRNEVKNIFDNLNKCNDEIEELICLKNEKNEISKFCDNNKLVDYLKPVLYDYANLGEIQYLKGLN